MPVEVFLQDYLFAIGVILVRVPVLALFNQMLIHLLRLDHLFTFPARHEHGALLPVVDVD